MEHNAHGGSQEAEREKENKLVASCPSLSIESKPKASRMVLAIFSVGSIFSEKALTDTPKPVLHKLSSALQSS